MKKRIKNMMKTLRHAFQVICPLLVVSLVATSLNAQTTGTPAVDSWLLNTTDAKGTSPAKRPSPPAPCPYSPTHIFWARLAAIDMTLTTLTGWLFYYLAFVAA